MSRHIEVEIASQPELWERAITLGRQGHDGLPRAGERVAVVGCGTSWFVAQSYAALREATGQGETDAFPASDMPARRRYDRVLALSRSGTTTEVLDLLGSLRGRTPTSAITADPATPVTELADEVIVLADADEKSVVQTRFATTQLALLRAHLGLVPDSLVFDGRVAIERPLEPELVEAEQFTFLGQGWTVGLAHEAALKMREAAGVWAESYPAMEYRHGPIAVTEPGRVVWSFGPLPDGLADEVTQTGGTLVAHDLDPLADLVLAQRLAVALAARRGVDPDVPRHLTRSVILASS